MVKDTWNKPFKTAVHGLFVHIRFGFIIIFMEKPFLCLGMPYKDMTTDTDFVIRIFIIPLTDFIY